MTPWIRRLAILGTVTAAACGATQLFPAVGAVPPAAQRSLIVGEADSARLQTPVRVVVWNIYKGQRDDFADDFKSVTDDAQLCLLQEYHETSLVHGSLQDTGLRYDVGVSFRFRSDHSATGVATGCVASPLQQRVCLSPGREPVIATPKAALLTCYPHSGASKSLAVVNMHGLNFVGLRTLRRQFDEVAAVVRRRPGPVLLAGDFNTNTAGKLAFLREQTRKLGMQELQFGAGQRMTAPLTSLPLDYVFYRGMEIQDAKVHDQLDGSDHKAMSFTITSLE